MPDTEVLESTSPEPGTEESTESHGAASETEEGTQDAEQQQEKQEEPKPQRKSLKELLAEDPELNAEYQRERDREIKKRLDRDAKKRMREEAQAAKGDPDRALDFVEKFQAMPDAPEDEAELSPDERGWRTQQLLTTNVEGGLGWLRAEPEYSFLYEHHKGELDKQITKLSSVDFARWVLKEGREREINALADQRANGKAKPLAEAMSTDQTARALRDVPRALNGNAGGGTLSDDAFIADYASGKSDDHKRYQQIMTRRGDN